MSRTTNGARCVALLVTLFLICCGAVDTVPPRTSADPEGSEFSQPTEVVLRASEPAIVYATFAGEDPEPTGEGILSGESPLRIELPEGVSELRFFSIDLSGNRELGVGVETYLVDTTPPEVTLIGDDPEPLGLLEVATLEWKCNEVCEYRIERGGDGEPESGELLEEGSLEADEPATFEVAALELPADEPLSFWIHAQDWTGRVGSLEVPLERAQPVVTAWPHSPGDVIVEPAGDRAYVARRFGQELDVVDLDRDSPSYLGLAGEIDVGVRPWKLALTPDGSRIYASNTVDPGAIAVVATSSDTTMGTVEGVGIPGAVAFSPAGDRGYQTDFEGRVTILDTDPLSSAFHTVVDRVFIDENLLTGLLAISSLGNRAVLNWSGAAFHGCELLEVDPVDGRLVGILASPIETVIGAAGDIALESGGEFGYIASSDPERALFRLDLATASVGARVTLDDLAGEDAGTVDVIVGGQRVIDLQSGLVLTDDDEYLLSVGPNGDSMKLFRAETLEELARVEIGEGAVDIAITRDGTRALITRAGPAPALVVVPLR